MARLVMKFGNKILKEVSAGQGEISIGRSPNSSLVIDNPAVSHAHARIYKEADQLILEDFGSLNGTLVNGQRVHTARLKHGDSVVIGKHTILFEDGGEPVAAAPSKAPALPMGSKPRVSKIAETEVLGTRERREFLQRLADAGENSQARVKVPTLIVRKGKTDQTEYVLTDKLTVIGKSTMATIRLRGWLAPKVAAQITRRDDSSYFIGAAGKVPRVNGRPVDRPVKLRPGDVIEVGRVRLEFQFRA
jgi:pSer/pThr/pTyr-binding forkhead associated (FHA) protein